MLHDCEISIIRCFPLRSNTNITSTAEENQEKISSHGCQLLFYCILWRACMTLFSQGCLWFVLERYAKEWGSPHKNSWLKCKMLWIEHKDVLACLFHSTAPSLYRAGQGAAALALMHRAHSTCCRSHFCQESLCYFCVSSRDILARNQKEAQQGASEEPITTWPSTLEEQAPCSILGPIPLTPPQPTPHWTSLLPHKTSTGPCFWGARGVCVRALLWSLKDTCSAHIQRWGRISHCTVTQHTPMSDNNVQFTGLDMDTRMHGTGPSNKKYTFREIDIYIDIEIYSIHTYIWVYCVYR